MTSHKDKTSDRQLIHDQIVDQQSKQRRKKLLPFAVRLVAITPVKGAYLSSSVIALSVTNRLGISLSERTVQNYLSLSTRAESYWIPKDFKERLRQIRMRPKCLHYKSLGDLESRFRLLDDIYRACCNDWEYEPIIECALDEIEHLRKSNWLQFNVQKPRRISIDQPTARGAVVLSTQLADSPHFDFRDEMAHGVGEQLGVNDEMESLPQLISLRDYRKVFDPEAKAYVSWWAAFSGLRTDSVPYSVQELLAPDNGRRPRKEADDDGYPIVPSKPTMPELLLWQKGMREYRLATEPMTETQLFVAFDGRGDESSRAFFDRVKDRLPASIKSYRTFQRREAARRA